MVNLYEIFYVVKEVEKILVGVFLIGRIVNFHGGSNGEVDRASAFHFNDPGVKSRFGHRIFLQDFIISATLASSGPLSGESTFQFPCFHHEMSVCKSE
jgi:hypothetical protein